MDKIDRPIVRVGRRIGSDIRISLPVREKEDLHHCKCFKIVESLGSAKKKLENIGFKPQIFEDNHGQVFGLALRFGEYEQIHVKAMSDGEIEAEIEPPPAYPGAHLNKEHSYSAHQELELVLNRVGILHIRNIRTPITCVQRIIKKPIKPTHAVKIVVGVALAVVFVGILISLAKGSKG